MSFRLPRAYVREKEMKTVKWWLDTELSREVLEGEFEVEDDATETEIEELAKLEAFNYVDWGWEVKKEKLDRSNKLSKEVKK